MKMLLNASLALAFFGSVAMAAGPDAAMQADNQAVLTACAAEAKAGNCGSEVVGKGLLRCLGTYRKANKGAISPGCKAALEKRREDKKAGK